MEKQIFNSIFAGEIDEYLNLKISFGFKKESYFSHLKIFDWFCIDNMLESPVFDRELAEKWI